MPGPEQALSAGYGRLGALTAPGVAVTITDGPAGVKLGQLRAWLYGTAWTPRTVPPTQLRGRIGARGKARIQGVTVELSREDVLQRAREALSGEAAGADNFRDWCVVIDGRRVSTQWLVSVLTGLPTTTFEASRAREVLLALGFDIAYVGPAPVR